VQDKSKNWVSVRAWIYKRPGGSVLEFSASLGCEGSMLQWIENETKRLSRPSFSEVFLQRHFDGK